MDKGSALLMTQMSVKWASELLDKEPNLYRKELNELLGHLEAAAQLVRSVLSEEL